MRFQEAFMDELNKLSDTNTAQDVAKQWQSRLVRTPVVTGNSSADRKGGFMKTVAQSRVSSRDRQRTGNVVGQRSPWAV